MRGLRRLQGHRRVCVNPARVLAESEEPPQVLQTLDRGQRRVRPAVAERAQRGHVELLEMGEALRAAERQQLALDQFAALLYRRAGEVPCDGILEVRLDRAIDVGDVSLDDPDLAGCLPAVNSRRGGRPVAGVE